jgi:RNA polymerase sigma-70 factor (ECF subfamily)
VHQDRIYGLVFRMVREASLAEELTQDTFIKAFRNLGSFRGEARLTTWLYRIAVNLCHDQRQSVAARVRRRELSLEATEGPGGDPPAAAGQPDEIMAEGETARHFQGLLLALDPPLREAFLLRHQEGLGYEEIASVLEITRTNAKVRVHRARERILEGLRRLGHDV